jgi:DNA-binding beta-propeller fold protein YncE
MKMSRTLSVVRLWIGAVAVVVVAEAGLSTAAIAATPAAGGDSPTGPYAAVAGWLKPVESGRVVYPVSVFAESPDRIFVANKGTSPIPGNAHGFDVKYPGTRTDHLLLVVDRNGKVIEEWSQWASLFGSLHKVKINPYDPDRHVWVIDRASQQVLEFTHDGSRLVRAIGERGVAGNDERHFGRPTDIAWLPDGTFFISDGYDNTRVVKFDANGRFLMQWGTRGKGPGEFDEPHGIAVDAMRRVYVVDRLNTRIQIFDENGKFLAQWTDFESPAAVIVSADQSVWVLDNGAGRVKKYDTRGKLLFSWGAKGDFPGGMADPHDFAVGPDGTLYISNGHDHRVDKYVPRPGAPAAQLVGQPLPAAKTGSR